jgi:cytoskeleton protein RodZ
MNTGGEERNFENAAPGASPVSGERDSGASVEHDNGQLALPLSSGSDTMRAEELDKDGKSVIDLLPHDPTPNQATDAGAPNGTLGHRLRAAREAMGLSRAEAATKLRLPLRVLARLEDDDYQGMDEGVYLRGYLSSYARLVGVPVVIAENAAAAHARVVPLVATGTVSRSRYLFDRYSVSATYLILTGLIVVPAVWLATHGGLEQNLARTTSLDSPTSISVPPIAQTGTTDASDTSSNATTDEQVPSTAADATTTVAAVEPPKQEQMPVVASMTPFSAQAPAAAPMPEQAAPAKTGAHTLTLKIKAASWVEIIDADGTKLEYGILPAGAERSYSSDGQLSVRLGNAEGAEVGVDGKPGDLAPCRRANVARLRVFGPEGVEAPRSEF